MRLFQYITLGVIEKEINEELRYNAEQRKMKVAKVSRSTLLRNSLKLGIINTGWTAGGWRTYTRERAEELKRKIKEGMSQPTNYTVQLA